MSKKEQPVHACWSGLALEIYERRAHQMKVLRAESFGRALPSVDPKASVYERRQQEVRQQLAIS